MSRKWRAKLYIMIDDIVVPKRRWVLRRDRDGLVHWCADYDDSATASPLCHEESKAKLEIFFRNSGWLPNPTCVWCCTYRMKATRPRDSDQRRFARR